MSPGPGTPDVIVGGRGYVETRNEIGSTTLWPADLEISADEARSYYRRASEFVARQVDRGDAPWMRSRPPGHALPEQPDGKAHEGHNALWLQAAADRRGFTDPRWGTRGELELEGARVRPGETPTTVVVWREHSQTGTARAFQLKVFNAEQCDGLVPDRDGGTPWRNPNPSAHAVLAVASPQHSPTAAPHYDPAADAVVLPHRESFPSEAAYLREGLRQVGHWTGHPSRLARDSFATAAADPSAASREELRGEIHALLAGCRLGVGHDPAAGTADRHAAWARLLRGDPHELHSATTDAERMLGFTADRARQRIPTQAQAPRPGQPTAMAELAREILKAPPWDRSR